MTSSALELGALRKATASLKEALAVVGDQVWFAQQPSPVRNTLLAGVVQNFEFAYEISVKMIKRRIELDTPSPARSMS